LCHIVFLLLGLWSQSVLALDPDRQLSQFSSKNWGVDEQLPQVSVTSLAQDKQGYIWIGTQSGVARFNGKEFVNFNKSNTSAFKSNIVKDILLSSKQELWILTENGVVLATAAGFQSVPINNQQIVKPNKLVEFEKELIISSSNGLYRIHNLEILPYLSKQESYAMAVRNNSLFVGGRGNFSTIQDGTINKFFFPERFKTAIVNGFEFLDNKVWLATSQGLLKFQDGLVVQPIQNIPALSGTINTLYVDEHEILWVASDTSIVRLKDELIYIPNEKESYHRASTFLKDRDNTLWIGTSDRGLYQIWDSWSVRYSESQGLTENLVWSVATDSNNNLFVGTQEGIFKLNDDSFEIFVDASALPNPAAYTLFVEHSDLIWVGTKSGVLSVNGKGEVSYQDRSGELSGLQIQAIYKDSKGRTWIATEQGVFLRTHDKIEQLGMDSIYQNRSYRAVVEFQGKIYLGTHQGLVAYEEEDGSLISLKILKDSFVTSLAIVEELLIVGTYSEGLFLYNGSAWNNLDSNIGLVFDNSFSLSYLNDFLWVSGFDGVYRLDFKSVRNYLAGARSNILSEPVVKDSGYLAGSQKAYCCNGAGHAKSAVLKGDIWYPTRKGVLKLEPDKVVRNLPLVNTIIEKVESPDGQIDMYFRDSGEHDYEKLTFKARDISFRFIGLTSLDEGLVKYRYRLTGYSSDWKDNGATREVYYTNLPQGDYVFEVLASNRDGNWARQPSQLSFSIEARFHETVYFKASMVFVSLILLYSFYRFIIYRNRKRVRVLEQLILKKTEALTHSNQELAKANERLTVHSYTDPLTGIHNRRYFVKQIVSDISHYVRTSSVAGPPKNIVFILADIDFFKSINDKYGHYAGDEVLKQVVYCLKQNIRDGDYLIRWGGEEFLLALRPDHVSRVEEMCDRLLKNIRKHHFSGSNDEVIDLTISLGFCFYPMSKKLTENWNWEDALDVADRGLYQAKHHGRNRWVGFQLMPDVVEALVSGKRKIVNESDFQRYSGVGE